MSQSLCRNFIHLIFSTKERRPLLTDDIRDEMHGYLGVFCAIGTVLQSSLVASKITFTFCS